jgi:hypothetical protein
LVRLRLRLRCDLVRSQVAALIPAENEGVLGE